MLFWIVCCLAATPVLHAAARPAAPSNLRVRAVGVNAYLLEWEDNANNETGIEIWAGLGVQPELFQKITGSNLTSHTLFTNQTLVNETVSFQILAFNGAEGEERKSALTSIVRAKTPSEIIFGPPTNLTAATINDGSVRLAWADHSTREAGYEIQYRLESGKTWGRLGTTGPDTRFRIPVAGLQPLSTYEFRVRAFAANGEVTGFSNLTTARTRKFQRPTRLTVAAEGDGKFSFAWKDNSSIEGGTEIEAKSGNGEFVKYAEVGANVSEVAPSGGFSFRTSYHFRVRAFRIVDSEREYSAYSNVFEARSGRLAKPGNLEVVKIGRTSAKLAWTDLSSTETGFEIRGKTKAEHGYRVLGTAGANATSFAASDLEPGKAYEFRVIAVASAAKSAPSNPAKAITKDGIVSATAPQIFFGTSFSHGIRVSRSSQLTSLRVGRLPAGLTYQRKRQVITGVPVTDKLVRTTVIARFKDGSVHRRNMVFRIVRPPAAPRTVETFARANVGVGETESISLAAKFADPDTQLARRVKTTVGTFDLILYQKATPLTVENFLQYANKGAFEDSFFHRSIPDFVVQGGGFRHKNSFLNVPTDDPVKNEPGISNRTGTVAMAKLGGDPNSATSQWFVNVADNAENLNNQNGGFTVFGRVAGNGIDVVNAINDLPRGNYHIPLASGNIPLEDVPMNAGAAPAALDPAALVKIISVEPVSPLRFEASSSNSSIATAERAGSSVRITGVASGTAVVTVTAIDLDESEVAQEIRVTVP